MTNTIKKHPLMVYSEEEKVAYLSLIATIFFVDNKFRDEEKELLDELIVRFKISDEGRKRIYSFIAPKNDADNEELLSMLKELNDPILKYKLIDDLGFAATIDKEFLPEEYEYIFNTAKKLKI